MMSGLKSGIAALGAAVLCSTMAMAGYSSPRATLDVDLLIQPESLETVKACVRNLDYCIDTGYLKTAGDRVDIYRLVKPVAGDEEPIVLDLVIVNKDLKEVWQGRIRLPWTNGELSVVSKSGLVKMKRLRGSGRDQDDIDFLQDTNED